MTFAASIGEPPPRAMIVSGRKWRICAAPAWTVRTDGSGSTWSMICSATLLGRRLRTSMILSTKPSVVIVRR